ncbi:MAG: polymer-forming cytoskeletal protein [Candidatus Omnitrophica bacterium]|nr:polymer-forming cytoskeletal protein [Candidatus Omnitrophota bacterium]
MAIMRREKEKEVGEKILDVDASMQGTLSFRDPVNLKINGKFEGTLDTRGSLTIGENATVHATIKGESILIAGKVTGNINAQKIIRIVPPGEVIGDIRTPLLEVKEGAILQGNCNMGGESKSGLTPSRREVLTAEELARYLEVETSSVLEWAERGKIPAIREGNLWKFDRTKIDEWVSNEKIK